jgi:hypothetical protein
MEFQPHLSDHKYTGEKEKKSMNSLKDAMANTIVPLIFHDLTPGVNAQKDQRSV